ncbi:MAG: LCP family protein [Candidatus Paceibacterota bacterium]
MPEEEFQEYNFEFPKPEKPWFKRPLFYILFGIAIVIGFFAFQFGLAYNSITIDNGPPWWKGVANVFNFSEDAPPPIELNPIPEEEPDRLDILVLGIRGEDALEEGGLLTDTIMVVSIDQKTKKISMISIPRDLFIDILANTGNGGTVRIKGKINRVYESGLPRGEGLALSQQVFSRITGTYIDHVIVFDFKAFEEIVDTIGGVDVTLARPFHESSQWGYEFSLPEGKNHLEGEQALYYVRSRYSTSDFDRARRQQEVIAAIKSKALSLGFLANPLNVTSLFSDLKNNIRTDFKIWDIKDLLDLASAFSQSSIKNYVITTQNLVYETHTEGGEYILLPNEGNYDGIKNLFKEILN